MTAAVLEPRDTCRRCRRPTTYCYCALIPQLAPKTHVLFVQHPRERVVAIGTARMAHLALAGSDFVEGVRVDEHRLVAPVLARAAASPDEVALLFPGKDARPVEEWALHPPKTLVVLDGTWSQAKQLLTRNPKLRALPRVGYRPPAPGNYRIRKEPSDEHLATIEAVAAVLGILEGDAQRYESLLKPFTYMVDRQLEAIAEGGGRRLLRKRRPGGPLFELEPLRAHPERAVIVYGEVNCHAKGERAQGAPDLIHLVAARPATGERFEAVLKPRRPLGASTPARLRLDEQRIVGGEDVASALARFHAFLGASSQWCAWGRFARDVLVREGEPAHGFIDLRALTARILRRSPGGIDGGAMSLDVVVGEPAFEGRAGRMLAVLEGVYARLLQHPV